MEMTLQGVGGMLNISRGLVLKASRFQRTGFNPAVGQTEIAIWNEAVAVAYPASAATLTVSSGSANDTSAGTGARTVTLTGLDANYENISETITMNGQTGVTSTKLYLRVLSLTTLTAGSGGKNAGVIYAGTGSLSSGVPATIYTSMGAGYNQSRQAFTTVPAGTTAYILDISVTSDTAGAQVLLYTRTQGGVFIANRVNQVGTAGFQRVNIIPLQITAKTDIEYRATVALGNAKMSAQFEMVYSTNGV